MMLKPHLLLMLLIFLAGCQPGAGPAPTQTARPTQTAASMPIRPATATPTVPPSPTTATATATSTPTHPPIAAGSCAAVNPITAQVIADIQPEGWLDRVKQLSGAEPVTVHGQPVTLTTRTTQAMFRDRSKPSVYDFVLETLQGWYPPQQIASQPYAFALSSAPGDGLHAQNLMLTLPGGSRKDEEVILAAHLDSLNRERGPAAPGADDNASGSAALLEAARVLRGHHFQRTIRLVWFTGEEQGAQGSRAFVKNFVKDPSRITGVINLDMFAYDADDDHCFELHVGRLAASDTVGRCFTQSIQAYLPGQLNYDYLTTDATTSSDHASFWSAGVGAVEVLENYFANPPPGGCSAGSPGQSSDRNLAYHTARDTADQLNAVTAARITRAALAALMGLAGPFD